MQAQDVEKVIAFADAFNADNIADQADSQK
jgi:hypothetical protein